MNSKRDGMSGYARESKGLPMWHVVKVASQTSNEVVGLCGHCFPIKRQPTNERPDEDSLCAGCKNVEQQSQKVAPCRDCGSIDNDRSACPLCGAIICQQCAEREGAFCCPPDQESISTDSTPKKEPVS